MFVYIAIVCIAIYHLKKICVKFVSIQNGISYEDFFKQSLLSIIDYSLRSSYLKKFNNDKVCFVMKFV